MSYNSKKSITSIITTIVFLAAYIFYITSESAPKNDDISGWALLMLMFIGISAGALIVIQILFHIGLAIGIAVIERDHDEEKIERIISSSIVEDERDKLIYLKASHAGYICVGIGFITSLVSLSVGMSIIVALHITFGAFACGSIIEGILNIYFNEKGVRNA